MRKLLSALVLIVMLAQVLPLDALATVGKVLSKDELAKAYALTGLGTGGLAANNDGAYHAGMTPNLSWNASQMRDWLDDKLATDLNTVTDLLSQTAFTLSELEEKDPAAYARLARGDDIQQAQRAYLMAEALRETLRYYQDQLKEASGVIAEYGRLIQEEADSLFDSDRVRYSACIEESAAEIAEIRQIIADSAEEWEGQISLLSSFLKYGPSSQGEEQQDWDWINNVLSGGGEPVTNSAPVTRVSASNSRSNRLSAAAGVAANDVDANITVLSENEVAIELKTGTKEKPEPVKGVQVKVRDAQGKDAKLNSYTTNDKGVAVIPVNLFSMDAYEILHLYVEVDPRPQGYRDFIIEDMDLAKGESYKLFLTPVNGQSSNGETANAANDVYPYMMTFNGRDIMNSEYDMIYSTANDYEFEIKVAFRNTDGKNLPGLVMRYYGTEDRVPGARDIYVEPTSHNGDVYTFKGKWKQRILPTSGKDRKYVAFMFGKDAAANLTFTSKLVSHKSATDAPIDEGTGSTSVFQGVLEKKFSLGCKIPVIDVNISFNLPFIEYLPKININPGGYVTIYMGSSIIEDDTKKLLGNWQSKDLRAYKQAESFIEKKGTYANYKGKYNLAKDFYKTKGWKFMGESGIDVGFFVVATGRWELDKDVPDVKSTNVSLRVGTGITISYSFSWTISYPIGPVPVYVSFTLGIAAGFAMEHALNFCWVNGGFQNWELKPYNDITISISLSLGAALGVGIKGFLDAWVEISATLNLVITLSITSKTPTSMTLGGQVKLSVGATVFFISFRKDWELVNGPIWSSNASSNLLDYYMNADSQQPKQTQVTYGEPQTYPQLAKDAREVATAAGQSNVDAGFKVVEAGGKTFAFHLQKVKGKDGKEFNRVCWQCLNPDSGVDGTGSTQQIVEDKELNTPYNQRDQWLKNLSERNDYAFDVAADNRFVFLVVTAAKDFDKDGFPVRNELKDQTLDYRFNQNMMAYMAVLETDGKGKLSHRLSFTPENMQNFIVCFTSVSGYSDSVRRPVVDNYTKYTYDSFTNPHISFARALNMDPRDPAHSAADFEIYGEMPTVAYKDDKAQMGTTAFYYWRTNFKLLTDKNVASGMGSGYERVKTLNTLGLSNILNDEDENNGYGMEFVAISQPKNGAAGEKALELYDYEANKIGKVNQGKTSVVLDKGDIDNLVAATRDRKNDNMEKVDRRFFYTKREKSKDGVVQNRLYGLVIAPTKGRGTNDFEVDVTKYVYDAVMPTNHFDTVILNNVTYLYWVAAAQKQKDSDPTVWRIWGMAFDPNTNTVLDPSVLAEFKLPKLHYKNGQAEAELNAAVSNAILLGSGTGYLNAVATNLDKIAEKDRPKVAPIALFSFEEKLKPAANLITAIPRALAVKAGDFEDVTLGIMNEGNVPIAAFDIGMYEVVDGKEGDKPVETVHINGIDSTKNKITMADGKVSRTGKEVAYREEDYGNISRKHDWVLDSETKAYKLHKNPDSVTLKSSDVIKASKPEHIKVQTLMPGAVGNYCAAFKIPENWHGDKTLRLKVTAVSVESNVMAAVANASGLAANGEGESATLNYALNPKTGKLELQMPVQPNGVVANAIASGLYANEIDVMDTDVVLDVHDIELKHRIYEGPEGERMLDITVRNYAATRESLKLSCAVYADGASEPEYLNLPLYEKSTSNRRAQTITIPVSALVDDPSKHTYARVAVSVVGVDENAYANNEFDVVFGGENPLRFTSQPEDVVVQEGEDVSFDVEVGGGSQPYTYQWQVWDPVHEKWVDLKGFTEPTLRRKDIEKKWDGCVFRCVITDAAGTQIISETATLTVRDKVDTGDHSDLPLYSIVAMIAIILLIALRRRREIG